MSATNPSSIISASEDSFTHLICSLNLPSLLAVLWFLSCLPEAASQQYIVIDEIELCGNKRTKDNILFREMTISEGDSIPAEQLEEVLALNRYRLLNTGLFLRVSLDVAPKEGKPNHVGLDIVVREVLYIVPVPILEFADRNFNVWWVEQGKSLDRINYGIDFVHSNFSGRRDVLGILLQEGYTRKAEVDYTIPFINRQQTLGMEGNILWTRNREVIYTTSDNRQQFYRSDERFLFSRFRVRLGLNYRPGLWTNHRFVIAYHGNQTDAEVQEILNPDFFLDGRQRQRYFSLMYEFTLDERDIIPYPIRGQYFRGSIVKEGLGVYGDRDVLFLRGQAEYYRPLTARTSGSVALYGRRFLSRGKQAFYQNRALGYREVYIRGFEYYVIDGMDFIMIKSSMRYALLDTHIRTFGPFGIEALRRIPLRIYLTVNLDGGMVHEPFYSEGNPLANRWLTGGGVGIDFVVLYNKVVRLEYSANDLGEKGVFLHYQFQF